MADRLSSDLASLRIDRDEAPPRTGRLRLLVILAALLGVGAAVYFVVVPIVRSKVFKTEVAITEISVVSPAQGQVLFTSTGYALSDVHAQVGAKVAGRVIQVAVKTGDKVTKGQLLLELDRVQQESAIRTAKARVASARAAAQTVRAQVVEAQNQERLARDMAERGVGARAAAIDAAARVHSLQAAVRAADAQARAVQQEVEALQVDLANYTVVAPFDGTVSSDPPEVGDMVGPSFGGVASQLGSIELVDLRVMKIYTDVPEGRLHMVEIGKPCEAILEAYPDARHRCRVSEILPYVDRAKATAVVKVAFVDQVPAALPNMSARVSFLSAELDPAAMKEAPKKVVPESAVVRKDGATVVFAVEDDRVRMLPVVLGPQLADAWELRQGPEAGTKVVANPPEDLGDGQKIKEKSD